MLDTNAQKAEIRKKIKDKLSFLNNIEEKNNIIFQKLIQDENILMRNEILIFSNLSLEPDMMKLFKYLLSKNKSVYFPRCEKESNEMHFYKVDNIAELEIGAYNIREPKSKSKKFDCANSVNSLCLVPGLAFSKNGARLGRGKGYYDKYLENYKGICIGLCFKEQILEHLPTDEFDFYMNYVISD